VTRLIPRSFFTVVWVALIVAFGPITANADVPTNTQPTNAIRIYSLPFTDVTDLSEVTEVWYVFTATETVRVVSPFTGIAALTVYQGESDQPVERSDSFAGRSFVATAGETYYFKLARFFDFIPGPTNATIVLNPLQPLAAISLFESRLFTQAQAHGPPRLTTNAGSLDVWLNYTSTVSPLVLRLPDGRRAKPTNLFGNVFGISDTFSSRTEMDLFFPAGTYSLTFPSSSYFTNVYFLNVPRSFFPIAPRLLYWNAAQRINSYLPFELRITRPVRYATYNTATHVSIAKPGEVMVVWFTSVGLNKVIIPDGVLEPNTRYQCWISVYYYRSSQPYGDPDFPDQLADTSVYFSATTETEIHTSR
jgi:hypothetical protein